ncbi:MAG: hypothetical protein ACR5LF_10075 [Symbiopectobacterium sp.]
MLIKDGVLHTDDLLVDGLEADIAMKGSVDLANRQIVMEAVIALEISATVGVATALWLPPLWSTRLLVLLCLRPARCWHRSGTKSR